MGLFSTAQKRLLDDRTGLGKVRFEADIKLAKIGRAAELVDYCTARRDGRFMPRSAIRPRELLALLPHLFIADIGPDDVYYRLGGTAIVSRLGAEVTGRSAREIFEPVTAGRIIHCFQSMAKSGEIMTWQGRYYGVTVDNQPAEIANIPILCDDGQKVQIFGGVFF